MPAAAIAALLAMPLAACSPTQPTRSPTPTPVHTALFASDAEALKAATDAYAAYQHVTDEVLHAGGQGADRYEKVALGSALEKALDGARQFREKGLHTTGESRFDSVQLQERSSKSVSFYVCDDVSDTDLLNSSGQSQAAASGTKRTPWQVEAKADGGSTLLISKRDFWTGSDFCQS